MTEGLLYVDPDTVSAISSQMLRTADEIDSLKNAIVPQVQYVINMSYSSWELRTQAWNAQESLNHFNFLSSNVDEIRTAAYHLTQVADAARANNTWLSQITTFFTSDAVKSTADNLGSILTGTGKFMEGIPVVGPILPFAGIVLDVIAGGKYDKRTISVDILGGIIGEVVDLGLLPTLITIIHFKEELIAQEEKSDAQYLTGDSRNQMLRLAKEAQDTADHANIGKLYDDAGALIIDSGFPEQTIGSGNTPEGDLGNLFKDAGNVVLSIPQSEWSNFGEEIEVPIIRTFNNIPNPATHNILNIINGIGDFITQGPNKQQSDAIKNVLYDILYSK